MTTEATQTEHRVMKAELARHLQVSERTIEHWVQESPPCPSIMVGRGRSRGHRFLISEVEAWLRERSG